MSKLIDQTAFQTVSALAHTLLKSGRYPEEYKLTTRVYGADRRYIEQVDEDATLRRLEATMLYGLECGLPALHSVFNIVWYNGRPCVNTQAALSMIRGRHDFISMEESVVGEAQEDMAAACIITRQSPDGPKQTSATFSWQDAQRARLTLLDHYQEYPKRMLAIRARSWAIRDAYGDALGGLSIAEEQSDVDDLRLIKRTPQARPPDDIDEFTMKDFEESQQEPLDLEDVMLSEHEKKAKSKKKLAETDDKPQNEKQDG